MSQQPETIQLTAEEIQALKDIQVHLAAQVGAYWMLVLTIFLLILCCAAHALRFRRVGFVLFAVMSVTIFFIPSVISMVAGPVLMAIAILGFVNSSREHNQSLAAAK